MSNNSGKISQSNSGGGIQQAAIGTSINQSINNQISAGDKLTQSEVIEILSNIEKMILGSELPEEVKQKTAKYAELAKIEASEHEPDKQLISKNLERVTKNLEEVDKTVDTGKRIFEKVFALVTKVSAWLFTPIGSV